MSKVRVFELAKEMGLETSDVERVCKELGIDVPQKHLTHLSSEDVTRVKQAVKEAPRRAAANKETKVDGNVVRRRKKVEDDKPAPAAAPTGPATQVAGGAGSIATSPTTVRRKKVIDEPEPEPAAYEGEYGSFEPSDFVAAEPEPEPEQSQVAAESEPEPARVTEGSASRVAERPGPEAAAALPGRAPTDSKAVIVSRPSRRVEAPRVGDARNRAPERPANRDAAPEQPPAVTGRTPARNDGGDVASPRTQETGRPQEQGAPGRQAGSARAERVQGAQARAAQSQTVTGGGEVAASSGGGGGAAVVVDTATRAPAQNTSLVQVVRRVDDAIMQNLINEAQRRAERQSGGPRMGARPMGGPGGPGGPVGPRPAFNPGGPPSRTGLRPGETQPPGPPMSAAEAARRAKEKPATTVDPARGRVAWEKNKDKSFDDRVMRMKAKRKPGHRDHIEPQAPRAARRVIRIEDTVTVGELAGMLSVKASEIIKKLMLLGEMVTVNNVLDMDTVQLLAQEPEFNFAVENVAFDIEKYIPKTEEAHGEALLRDPVVTVMGHVDHGKTSLLDYIRKARVAAGEAGGITQHIGAYRVPVVVNGAQRHVVFLDTPGHAAFTAMRARGAQVTDIVILVVAADDGVMPQTAEAVNHAKAAGVPLVVAINKIDKPDAKPEKIRQQLTEFGIVAEEWGGDTQFVEVSAKTGFGIDKLLELLALQADVLELKAIANKPAKGVVIEAELSKGRGPVATVLVQEGTINRGDIIVAGKAMGRVRAMIDDRGRNLASAGPSSAIEILGLDQVPPPSARFFVVKDERDAKAIVQHLEDNERKGRLASERKKVSLDDLFAHIQAGELKTLNLVIKSDVQGSLEALRTAFTKLKHPELEVRIIHDAVGAISEHDVYLASASNAIIIGFNVRPEKNAKVLAEQDKVDIKLYSVIYNAVDDVKAAMEGMLKPTIEEKFVGRAAVRETFSIPKFGTIAGCAVLQGKLIRNGKARLIRDGRVVNDGKIDTLRRFKDQVTEVERGHECGVHLENFNDVKIGDEIECYELIEIAQKLELTL